MKSFYVKRIDHPWEAHDSTRSAKERMGRTMRLAQADYGRLHNAGVRLVSHAFVVPERYTLNKILTAPNLLGRFMRMTVPLLRRVLATQPFKIFQEELQFFYDHQKDKHSDRRAVVVRNFAEMRAALADPNVVAVLPAVEGAHNLGFEYCDGKFPERKDRFGRDIEPAETINENLVDERVAFIKRHGFFMLTLNHFVYNRLASMPKAVELTGWKKIAGNPLETLEKLGDYRGLTYLGVYMVEKCFENNIFIDVKHCDAVARRQIYALARKHRKPVIASHVAVSGRASNLNGDFSLLNKSEDRTQDRIVAEKFNPWDINLHDDDIVAIHASGGLMGLIMDVRVLSSQKAEKHARKTGQWVELLFNHIEYIYKTLVEAGFSPTNALDSICLGSDFDGIIDPIDLIPTAEEYRSRAGEKTRKLDGELLRLFTERRAFFADTGLDPEAMTRKILRENVWRFLEKNFV
jgi:microsomal dipeptidase-like Zn-dependent dipeptidase